MQLSEIEREQLYAIVEKYDHHPDVQRMRAVSYTHLGCATIIELDFVCCHNAGDHSPSARRRRFENIQEALSHVWT